MTAFMCVDTLVLFMCVDTLVLFPTCQASLTIAVALGPGGKGSLGHAAGQLVRHWLHIRAMKAVAHE